MDDCVNPTRSNYFQACLKSNHIEARNVFEGGVRLSPLPFIRFGSVFLLIPRLYTTRICFDALCNEKWFWTQQHFWKIVKSRNMQKHCKQKNKKLETQNTKRTTKNKTRTPNTNHKINKTAQTPGFDWFILLFLSVFFPGESSYRMFFGDMMCFDCVDFFVFQFLLKSNFSVETDVIVQGQMNGIVCVSSQIQPYLVNIYPRSNHIYPRHVF